MDRRLPGGGVDAVAFLGDLGLVAGQTLLVVGSYAGGEDENGDGDRA